jgi:hypothetical protein
MKRVLLAILLTWLLNAFRVCNGPELDYNFRLIEAERIYSEYEFDRFIMDLGFRESSNDWKSVNLIGCLGEWQFSEATLRFLGYNHVTPERFRQDPSIFPREMQLEALKDLISWNLHFLQKYEEFIGDTIKGVVVTKSGMIAASHLGGPKTLMNFLDSQGEINRADILGTSIQDYMDLFQGYQLN